MLGYVEIVPMLIFLFFYFYQGKESHAKTKLTPAQLRAMLVCTESDSAHS